MLKTTSISKEDLDKMVGVRSKFEEAVKNFEKINLEIKVMELEYRVLVQSIYLENGLNPKCQIDPKTGNVTWPPEQESQTIPEQETAILTDDKV